MPLTNLLTEHLLSQKTIKTNYPEIFKVLPCPFSITAAKFGWCLTGQAINTRNNALTPERAPIGGLMESRHIIERVALCSSRCQTHVEQPRCLECAAIFWNNAFNSLSSTHNTANNNVYYEETVSGAIWLRVWNPAHHTWLVISLSSKMDSEELQYWRVFQDYHWIMGRVWYLFEISNVSIFFNQFSTRNALNIFMNLKSINIASNEKKYFKKYICIRSDYTLHIKV